jgi:predicted RNA binding protein YcfA (HicA-like mRNA interferase family)
MAKLVPIAWHDLVGMLRKFGFDGPYSGGKHPYMIKGDLVLTIPNPHRKEISVDLLTRILKQAEITREEWLENDK